MKLTFGDRDILTIKNKCDKEHKIYKPIGKRRAFSVVYKDIIDQSEFNMVSLHVGGIIEDVKKYKNNVYEQKRLRTIAKEIWSNYVGCILRKKFFMENYEPFKRTDLQNNKLF